jgi:phospholipase C
VNPDNLTSASPAFDFKRLGVRVPAVMVSPYIKPGTVIGSPDGSMFEHASIIATARKLFLPDWQNTALNDRDKNAAPFDHVLSLATPDNNPMAAHAASMAVRPMAAPVEAPRTSKDKPLSALQSDMVKHAAQAEQDNLAPENRTGVQPADIQTEKQASGYLGEVARRLRGVL